MLKHLQLANIYYCMTGDCTKEIVCLSAFLYNYNRGLNELAIVHTNLNISDQISSHFIVVLYFVSIWLHEMTKPTPEPTCECGFEWFGLCAYISGLTLDYQEKDKNIIELKRRM